MKLSKLFSISVTTSAVTVYLFGVMAMGVFAQAASVNVVGAGEVVVTEADLTLVEPVVTGGFGLVVNRWVRDFKEKINNDPDEVAENAETELALLASEVESGDQVASEKLAQTRARYEEKLAKLDQMMANLDDTQREVLMQRMAKHEALLNRLYVYDAEGEVTTAVEQTLSNLEDWKQKALERFEAKKDRVSARLEQRKEAIQAKLEEKEDKLENVLDARKEVIEARKAKLEEIKAGITAKKEEMAAGVEVKKAEALKSVEVKETEAKVAQEKFKQNVEAKKVESENKAKVNKIESSADYQVVQGLIDYQPSGFLERVGWWLGGL